MNKTIDIAGIPCGNGSPFVLLAGMNVLESRDLAFEIASELKRVTSNLGIPYVFKASFDKANRSSINSYRGPGLDKGLEILADLKEEISVETFKAEGKKCNVCWKIFKEKCDRHGHLQS